MEAAPLQPTKMPLTNRSLLSLGNKALDENKFEVAIQYYSEWCQLNPLLVDIVQPNLQLATRQLLKSNQQARVAKWSNTINVDVYLTCWLRSPEPLHSCISYLARELQQRGLAVKVITHSQPLLRDESIDTINVDFALLNRGFYARYDEVSVPECLLQELTYLVQQRILSTETPELAKDIDHIHSQIRKAYSFWDLQLETTNPSLFFLWGSSSPISRLHQHLCSKWEVPYLVMERGHFSGTLYLDLYAQFGRGRLDSFPYPRHFDGDHYEVIEKWIHSLEITPYAHANSDSIPLALTEASNAGKKLVFFIGSNDLGSEIGNHREFSQVSQAYSWHSSYDALNELRQTLDYIDADTFLYFKPHPADKRDYSHICQDSAFICSNTNVNELIELADVVVTLGTTAIAQAVTCKKPIVLMSLSDISGKGIAYEARNRTELTIKLRAALERIGIETKISLGKMFIYQLFTLKLFSLPHICEVARSVDELISHVHALTTRNSSISDSARRISKQEREKVHTPRILRIGLQSPTIEKAAVVIPVYKNTHITSACIRSLMRSETHRNIQTLIINDASPDPDMYQLLESLAEDYANINVVHNEKNLGFPATVNKASEILADKDILILNSDALVSHDAVPRLMRSAYADKLIATVTPFSNNAGIYTVPHIHGEELDEERGLERVDFLDIAFYNKNSHIDAITMPMAHGFCIYIRRNVIDRIGLFDEQTFGSGYSEEIDFCLRAQNAGYLCALAPHTYVGHIGSVSFGQEAEEQKRSNRSLVSRMYPGYIEGIRAFRARDPISCFRRYD